MRAVVVHAINQAAVDFYGRFGFRGLSEVPRSLMVTLAELTMPAMGDRNPFKPRGAGSNPVGGTLASPDGSVGAKRDELLLRTPCDVEERDELRLGRIHDEIERGFDALRDIDDGVSIFGSARVEEGHRWYELCRETASCLVGHGFSVITGGVPGLMEAATRGPS